MNYETLDRKQRCTNNNNNNSDIVINNNRTIYYGFNSSETTTTYQSNNERNNESLDRFIGNNEIEIECKTNINIKIYRYKFTDSFIEELYKDYIVAEYQKKYKFKLHSGRINNNINTIHLVIKNF